MQRSCNAADVPFKTLRALGGAVKEALLPDAGVENASMHAGDLLNLLHSSLLYSSIVMWHIILDSCNLDISGN